MRNLKFLILALGLMLAQGVLAVTLPSTSYSPYGDEDQYNPQSVIPTGVKVTSGSFNSLKGYDDVYTWTDHCATEYPGPENIMGCQSCVTTDLSQCYSACGSDEDCKDWCDEMNYTYQGNCGRSLPLSAPLWFALLLPLVAGALKPLLRRKA